MAAKKLLIVVHAPSPNTQALLNALIIGTNEAEADGVEITEKILDLLEKQTNLLELKNPLR